MRFLHGDRGVVDASSRRLYEIGGRRLGGCGCRRASGRITGHGWVMPGMVTQNSRRNVGDEVVQQTEDDRDQQEQDNDRQGQVDTGNTGCGEADDD
jgi:hypothetical protein